ncbi:type II toxin-antitoxin system VapC family toxin [Parazoarcus communis]|uniref:VapC toxin family PIN domain ribonuclease n=1 Tax=Parazoarcus communis SWub3 = DSM 12120 TaxID=1121029 RepID=A0A323UWD4_9RHOO|nr:PIN domain-containing protein [Parazoarcus communis]NMG68906.1 PIN domain-containing protein [Parazoarcus communis SWub3 = DSM 12120]PZA16784.1 VapC toxin family PIN domain ribonuclease [Azoarcus communis] [Parazoarcus communis SWub3 = DSM 12120]
MIVDAGPLIALFNPADRDHARCIGFLKQCGATLTTTWPVLTEAMHVLRYSPDAQLRLLNWVERGGLSVADLDPASIAGSIRLMDRHPDRPMDLADASVVLLALQTGCRDVMSIDSDFDLYRLPDGGWLNNVLRDNTH